MGKFSDKLHRVHLWSDFSIGVIALVGLLIRDVLEAWYQIDLVFHIIIFTLAAGMILAERVLHGSKHTAKIFGSGLHKIHLLADLSISTMAVVGLLFEDVLEAFFQADIVFHIAIIILVTGVIVSERILHRHKHSGVIGS
jgi:hypothetical protein